MTRSVAAGEAIRGASRTPGMSRRRRVRKGFGAVFTYIGLVLIGVIVIFPFVFMFTTSLKTSEEVFSYPPRLLPAQPKTVAVEGFPEPLPLYRIQLADTT